MQDEVHPPRISALWGNEAPTLSVVVTARNDDHGKNMLRRMQIFVTGFLEQARLHALASELIIVEWNPPADRPRLADALSWEGADGPCQVRIIEVPAALHRRYRHADRLALFQMIAKNVGVRRARGRFVLCTNIDLLFSDELMRFCASGRLDPGCMYRVDRLDVPLDVPIGIPVAEQLEYCRRNVLRVNTRWGTFVRGQSPARVLIERLWRWLWRDRIWAAIRGRLARLAGIMATRRPRRWVPDRLRRGLARLAGIMARRPRRWVPNHVRRGLARLAGIMATRLRSWVRSFREDLLRFIRALALGSRRLVRRAMLGARLVGPGLWHAIRRIPGATARLYQTVLKPLHTNGCGDFTLLARERWRALRGYPEIPMFSLHLDSVFCQMAHHSGVREVVLGRQCHTYHMDHDSGWSPQGAARLAKRMEDLGVPVVDRALYDSWVETMRQQRGPIIFNGEEWGLAVEDLAEIDPARHHEARRWTESRAGTTLP